MDIKIEWQNTKTSPYWKSFIEERLNAFKQGRQKITHARMTIRKNLHHLNGSEEATLVLSVSGKVITATKTGDTLGNAINLVLDTAEQEWQRYRDRKQRIGPKISARNQPTGVIARLFKDREYGFIQSEGGDIYFHKNSVRGMSFKSLQEGTRVEFQLEAGNDGWQASWVMIR
jgi:cold shock CspA family protein/ribosome-associated translation inhibitor RaiA